MSDELSFSNDVDFESLYEGQQSQLILVIGKSGRGKSTSLYSLDPSTTHLINVLGKPLPFQKGMKYKNGENMTISTQAHIITRKMKEISDKQEEVKTIVIDDAQYIMATEFMEKAKVKGYEKFTNMARNFWDILYMGTKLRGDLKVVVLIHEDETPSGDRKAKTLGKLLDDKITIEGLSSIVLFSDILVRENANKYVFITQSDGRTSAKSPMGMFPMEMPNDLHLVVKRIDEYYAGVELKDSKFSFGG